MTLSRLFVLALLSLLLFLQYKLWFSPDGVAQYWTLTKNITALSAENTLQQQKNSYVATEVRDLKEGTQAVEERARDDLGLIKPGEVYYQIVGDSP